MLCDIQHATGYVLSISETGTVRLVSRGVSRFRAGPVSGKKKRKDIGRSARNQSVRDELVNAKQFAAVAKYFGQLT